MPRYKDADALRKAMYHEAFEKDSDDQRWDSGCWIRYKMFERVLDSLPTADVPDRKVGKWIEINIADYKALCSVCKTWSLIMSNYCPNCGARMFDKDMNVPGKGESDGRGNEEIPRDA